MTNSAVATRTGMAAKFGKLLGDDLQPPVRESEIMCTAYATSLRLQRTVGVTAPDAKDVYVIGAGGLVEELSKAGFTCYGLEDSASLPSGQWTGELTQADLLQSRVAAVVIGVDRDVSYLKMTKAVCYLRRDPECKFLVTNRDKIVPFNDQLVPSNGMVVAGIECSAERPVDELIGKPTTTMIDLLDETAGLNRDRSIMVGDNLDTDILFGIAGGTHTMLVLSGVSSEGQARARAPADQPEVIADSVKVLADRLTELEVELQR
mmetsp:Transcript_34751/g.92664  ORF Transcript_34751/g.92664 Transcript_34751/m.92664 type:complete len:263 (-) Transcript_34751:520-1308(-)